MDVFADVDTMNKRCLSLEKQLKTRELQEKQNLEKMEKVAERFQFMSRMI